MTKNKNLSEIYLFEKRLIWKRTNISQITESLENHLDEKNIELTEKEKTRLNILKENYEKERKSVFWSAEERKQFFDEIKPFISSKKTKEILDHLEKEIFNEITEKEIDESADFKGADDTGASKEYNKARKLITSAWELNTKDLTKKQKIILKEDVLNLIKDAEKDAENPLFKNVKDKHGSFLWILGDDLMVTKEEAKKIAEFIEETSKKMKENDSYTSSIKKSQDVDKNISKKVYDAAEDYEGGDKSTHKEFEKIWQENTKELTPNQRQKLGEIIITIIRAAHRDELSIFKGVDDRQGNHITFIGDILEILGGIVELENANTDLMVTDEELKRIGEFLKIAAEKIKKDNSTLGVFGLLKEETLKNLDQKQFEQDKKNAKRFLDNTLRTETEIDEEINKQVKQFNKSLTGTGLSISKEEVKNGLAEKLALVATSYNEISSTNSVDLDDLADAAEDYEGTLFEEVDRIRLQYNGAQIMEMALFNVGKDIKEKFKEMSQITKNPKRLQELTAAGVTPEKIAEFLQKLEQKTGLKFIEGVKGKDGEWKLKSAFIFDYLLKGGNLATDLLSIAKSDENDETNEKLEEVTKNTETAPKTNDPEELAKEKNNQLQILKTEKPLDEKLPKESAEIAQNVMKENKENITKILEKAQALGINKSELEKLLPLLFTKLIVDFGMDPKSINESTAKLIKGQIPDQLEKINKKIELFSKLKQPAENIYYKKENGQWKKMDLSTMEKALKLLEEYKPDLNLLSGEKINPKKALLFIALNSEKTISENINAFNKILIIENENWLIENKENPATKNEQEKILKQKGEIEEKNEERQEEIENTEEKLDLEKATATLGKGFGKIIEGFSVLFSKEGGGWEKILEGLQIIGAWFKNNGSKLLDWISEIDDYIPEGMESIPLIGGIKSLTSKFAKSREKAKEIKILKGFNTVIGKNNLSVQDLSTLDQITFGSFMSKTDEQIQSQDFRKNNNISEKITPSMLLKIKKALSNKTSVSDKNKNQGLFTLIANKLFDTKP